MSSRSKMTLSTIGYDDKRRRVEVSSLGFNGREMASDVGDELSVSPMKPPVTSSTVLNRSAEPPERDKKKLSRHVSWDLGSVGFGLLGLRPVFFYLGVCLANRAVGMLFCKVIGIGPFLFNKKKLDEKKKKYNTIR